MGSPFGFPFTPPTPEQVEQIEAYQQAAEANAIAWRRTVTGPWAFLWCACKEAGPERCRVHGAFLLTRDGDVL